MSLHSTCQMVYYYFILIIILYYVWHILTECFTVNSTRTQRVVQERQVSELQLGPLIFECCQ